MFLCLVMGIYSYNSLGRSEDPSFTIKQMVVSAAWPGATAKEVEEHLTDKIEKQLQTVPNIDRITSYSRPGTAVINVYLQDTVPVKEIKQRWLELRNIVNDGKGDLPDGALGPFFNDRFDDVYGNIYAVTSDSFSYEEMRVVAENIKDKFFDKYIYKVEFAEMLRIVPGNLQECYLFFCRNITYYSAQK